LEKRRYKRWLLTKPLKIYNKKSNSHIGNLIDITIAGLGMVSKFPLKPDTTLQFKIDLTEEKLEFDSLELEAKNIWCEENILNRYIAGLKIKNGNKKIIDKIKDIIIRFGYIAHDGRA